MIEARCEVTLKFFEVPFAQPTSAKTVIFAVLCGAEAVTVEVKQKAFKKLQEAPVDFPNGWICAVSGKLGPRTKDGFTLLDAGIQVFEKKIKPAAPAESGEVSL